MSELTHTETMLLESLLESHGLISVLGKLVELSGNGASTDSPTERGIKVVNPEHLPAFAGSGFTQVNGQQQPRPPHKKGTRHPEARRQQIRELHAQGESVSSIARRFRMDDSSVYYIVKHPPTQIGKRV